MPENSTLSHSPDRRDFLKAGSLAAGVGWMTTSSADSAAALPGESRFKMCLNMSTIMGQELNAAEEIDVAGEAGYDSIEPWFRRINAYVEEGGSLKDLKKRIDDHGLSVESAIGFATWAVNDPEQRAAGLEEAKRDMDTIAQLGGVRIAAPPAGIKKTDHVDLDDVADRYRVLLELGDEMGVVPQVEMWGGHPTIGTVEKAVYVAIRAGHPKACFLGDVYHTYKGGSSFDSILLMGPGALQSYHLNDYPADPPRGQITDADRVYPGDGVAPIAGILNNFKSVGAYPVLSLELFNRSYWEMPALECARVGLDKMRAVVAAAG
ncbi:MAG: sugar phosphate isomerase/epimerase [Verrucomicrobiales bacterium]|nr:sugar phosphate isomerase/epimerase [Verrucomicrobiales bacterium]